MASSGLLRHMALVRTDVSEELSASVIRVTRLGELGTRHNNPRRHHSSTKLLINTTVYGEVFVITQIEDTEFPRIVLVMALVHVDS
jgi:hypothetical protein